MSDHPTVSCVISTKNRSFTTLPMTIMGVCNQSIKPNNLIIYDDGDFKPELDKHPIYSKFLSQNSIISSSGISWEYKYGGKCGQVFNYIQSLKDSSSEFIWRLDDDNIPDFNVLEGLLNCVDDTVGAVGGLVINYHMPMPVIASNKIEDIYLGLNEQWFFHPSYEKPKEVDHLYSSFLYRKSIAEYPDNLSTAGYREETILTYEMKRKGYKIILNPKVKTWHFNNPEGGIRTESNIKNIEHDSHIFSQKLNEWGVKLNEYSMVVLEHGIGDTFAFKSILPQYFETYPNKTHIFFVAYPDVFYDVPNIKLASIADAKVLFGGIEKFDVYKFIGYQKWDKNLPMAYKKIYNIKGEVTKGRFGLNDIRDGTGKTIIISPWSYTPDHPKSYPFWPTLVNLLIKDGYEIIQIGKKGEETIPGVVNINFDLSFKQIEEKISQCRLWISIDNFLQHLVNSMTNPVKGVVIWGVSNPVLFGYQYNTNILKSKGNLRRYQIAPWSEEKQNPEVFLEPDKIFEIVKTTFK